MPVRRHQRYSTRYNNTKWNRPSRTTRRANGRAWTPQEVTTLRKIYRDTPTKDIARRFSRSISSVQAKAGDLGLKKTRDYMRKIRQGTWR